MVESYAAGASMTSYEEAAFLGVTTGAIAVATTIGARYAPYKSQRYTPCAIVS